MKQFHIKLFFLLTLSCFIVGKICAQSGQVTGSTQTQRQTMPCPTMSRADSMRYQYFFLEAVRQTNAGHDNEAERLLRRCQLIDSCASEPYFLLGKLYLLQDRDSMALGELSRAASLCPKNETYQELLAQTYINMHDYARSIPVLERQYEANKNRTEVLELLFKLYDQQNNYPMMLDALDRIMKMEGDNEQLAMARMSVYERMGDAQKAYQVLKNLADSHSYDLNFTVMLGNWLMQHKREKEAYQCFARALEEDPQNSSAQVSMYDYYRTTGHTDLEKQMFNQILLGKNTPENIRLQFLRDALQSYVLNPSDSLKGVTLLDSLCHQFPDNSEVASLRVAYFTLKKLPVGKIEDALNDLLRLKPDDSGARVQLIESLWKREKWEEVAKQADAGILYNPDELAFYYTAAMAYYYLQDDKTALSVMLKGLAKVNDKSDVDLVADMYSILGELYHSMGDSKNCYAAYDSCLKCKPDHVTTLNNYAYYLSLEDGNLKKAESLGLRAVTAEPKNSTFLDTYAWVLYRLNRIAEAKIYIDQALANMNDSVPSADVYEHAGDIYAKSGDSSGAIKYWKEAIQAGGDKEALEHKINLHIKQ